MIDDPVAQRCSVVSHILSHILSYILSHTHRCTVPLLNSGRSGSLSWGRKLYSIRVSCERIGLPTFARLGVAIPCHLTLAADRAAQNVPYGSKTCS